MSNPEFSRRGANPKGGESQPFIWLKNSRKLPENSSNLTGMGCLEFLGPSLDAPVRDYNDIGQFFSGSFCEVMYNMMT